MIALAGLVAVVVSVFLPWAKGRADNGLSAR
jgi:hypothetical protein